MKPGPETSKKEDAPLVTHPLFMFDTVDGYARSHEDEVRCDVRCDRRHGVMRV